MDTSVGIGGDSTDLAVAAFEVAGGGYLLAGSTRSFGLTNADLWAVRTMAPARLVFGAGVSGHQRTVSVSSCAHS